MEFYRRWTATSRAAWSSFVTLRREIGEENMLLKVDLQIERPVEKGWQYEETDGPLSLL